MRLGGIQLMALTICLLSPSLGRSQVPLSNPAGSNQAGGKTDSTPSRISEDASAPGDGESPPTSRPERGPAALEHTNLYEPAVANDAIQGVVELLRAGVDEEVLLRHIQNSSKQFGIGSEQIVFLTDLGAPGLVINAMMDRDEEIQSGQPPHATEHDAREPWPAAGTVAEVPPAAEISYTSATLPSEGEEFPAGETPTEMISMDYFYDYLGPYGTWINVPEYGLCWQPTVAVSAPGWKPYGDRGRWVYTDHGWYWYSDYSWGWAAFHYGRWFHHSQWGWCWAPGTVWGPSWVSWRYSSPYCGWAPLPPYSRSGFYFSVGISWGIPSWCYTYVPSYRICNSYPSKYAVPYEEARHIHRKSRIRNHYTVGRNHTIENRGIPPGELTDNSQRDIRQAQIKMRHAPTAGGIRREQLDYDQQTLTVYQPPRSNRTSAPAQTAARMEPRPRPRPAGISSPPARAGAGSSAETNRRRSSPNEPRVATDRSEGFPTGDRQDEQGSSTPSGADRVAPTSAGQSATTVGKRSEPTTRNRSGNQPAQTRPRIAAERPTESRRATSPPAVARPKNSIVITGQRASQQPSAPSARFQTPTLDRTSTTRRSTSIANAPVQRSFSQPPPAQSNSRAPAPSRRTWNVPNTRTQPSPPVASSPTTTVQPRTITRQSPTASVQQYRVPSSRSVNVSGPPPRTVPSRAPARAFPAPSSSVRPTPPARPTPSVHAPSPRAPSYTPSASRRSTALATPQGAPRSNPPGRSGDRSGSRSR